MTPAYAELLRQREERRHAALIRGEDGGLHIRRFGAAADAERAATDGREYLQPDPTPLIARPRPRRREWKLAAVAKELGVSARTVRRYLEWLNHRQPSPHVTYIDGNDVVLVKRYGLHGLARMRRGGMSPV